MSDDESDHMMSGHRTGNRLRTQIRALFEPHSQVRLRPSYPRIPHYELIRVIGRGGTGTVYLAWDVRHHRRVAIKILTPVADVEFRKRFRREAHLMSSFNHVNIVPAYGFIRCRDVEGLVMEYVHGRTLDQVIPEEGIPIEVGIAYATQIASALHAIHSASVINRDLKPRNFVIQRSGNVKLLDFGLAKKVASPSTRGALEIEQEPQTRSGSILGTVGYMSPEQVRGEPADKRSDVFSFGAILHEMLTGYRAYREPSELATMRAISRGRQPDLPVHIPPAIARIIKRCLARDPQRRYCDGGELLMDLKACGFQFAYRQTNTS